MEVRLGQTRQITPILDGAEPVLVDKGLQSQVEIQAELEPMVTAPVEKGQTLGTLTVTAGGETIASLPLVAPERVERLTWSQLMLQILRGACMSR